MERTQILLRALQPKKVNILPICYVRNPNFKHVNTLIYTPVKQQSQTSKRQRVKNMIDDLWLLSYSSVFKSKTGFHWLTTETNFKKNQSFQHREIKPNVSKSRCLIDVHWSLKLFESNRITADTANSNVMHMPESSINGLQGGEQAHSEHQDVEGENRGLCQPQK